MIFNGKKFAQEEKDVLRTEFAKCARAPRLDVIYVGADPAIESFMKMMMRVGDEVGAHVIVHRLYDAVPQDEIVRNIERIAGDPDSDGIIVQLPLPNGIDTGTVLNTIPSEKDVGVLSAKTFDLFTQGNISIVPPVARAMMSILRGHHVTLSGNMAVILGRGRLVGRPMRVCLEREGAIVVNLDKTTGNPTPYLLAADIIVSGVGKPLLIRPEMIKDRAVILDAGAGEMDGRVVGDAHPACADKCTLFTPVPGGIGPVMVAMLFRNLLDLIRSRGI